MDRMKVGWEHLCLQDMDVVEGVLLGTAMVLVLDVPLLDYPPQEG
jgi:hypothetical protein